MIEQEYASIIRFILNIEPRLSFYYHEMPENFAIPSIFCEMPEVSTQTDTTSSYKANFRAYMQFFGRPISEAKNEDYQFANKVLTNINKQRKWIPILDTNGAKTQDSIKIKKTEIKKIDIGVSQLFLTWESRNAYDRDFEPKIQKLWFNKMIKGANDGN